MVEVATDGDEVDEEVAGENLRLRLELLELHERVNSLTHALTVSSITSANDRLRARSTSGMRRRSSSSSSSGSSIGSARRRSSISRLLKRRWLAQLLDHLRARVAELRR